MNSTLLSACLPAGLRGRYHGGSASNAVKLVCPRAGVAAILLAGCTPGVLDPRGPISLAERTILIDSLAIMLAIVVPTILATLGFAWWFRTSNARARYLPDWSFSGRIELVVWSIPVMVIILLGGVTWIGAHQLDPAMPLASKAKPLEVQVVSLDWKWLFIYPELQVASVNELVVPAGVPLHFRLTSASVMNTFFVPQLGSMIYTMNGMTTELYLQADEPGTYRGLSGHFSGDGFSDMHFEVRALQADDFAAWLAATRKGARSLDADRYTALARQSASVPASTFAKVEDNLFTKVVNLELAPGPGPKTAPAAGAPDKGR
jgi:cytochrome o ubiquinol oxidase subunit 2